MNKGLFIVIDGIDGSGKSTVINAWTDFYLKKNKKIFYLKEYWDQNNKHPTFDEIRDFEVIISAEPTFVWTGASIREEMIKSRNDYSAQSIATAYSLDRLVLYKRVLLPALETGKTVLQDRSVSTSVCYQPIQTQDLSIEDIISLEGNSFALVHAPDHLVIADLPAEVAMQRLGGREEKQDNAIFEKISFLTKARDVFLSEKYQKLFKERNTKIHILNASKKIDIMKEEAVDLLRRVLEDQ